MQQIISKISTQSIKLAQKRKLVFSFVDGDAEGDSNNKDLLGNKGAGLLAMSTLGLPVPPGFIVTTQVCNYFYANNSSYPSNLKNQVNKSLTKLEKAMHLKFGDINNPLLISVRSGAKASMPGMMDTILNVGLNDQTIQGLINKSKDARFGYDSYRRLISMYADVVLQVPMALFEQALSDLKRDLGIEIDTDLSADDLKILVNVYKKIIIKHGKQFPEDPIEQLWGAIGAVFNSWSNPRAKAYRELNAIPEDWGTAIIVQAMVFGNKGADCATGVAFTRNPSTGENKIFGEYMLNAQGEDVVAGVRTPLPLNSASDHIVSERASTLDRTFPDLYQQLSDISKKLESFFYATQDIEFTIESGKLFILQTRNAKVTAQAAVKIAVDMVSEGLITKEDALLRIEAEHIEHLLHPSLDPNVSKNIIANGLPASPGAASGQVVFSSKRAAEIFKIDGRKLILVRSETSAEDIQGMIVSEGILTCKGGLTSHAAVVARGMGKTCIAGCMTIHIDEQDRSFTAGSIIINEGDYITLDGTTGDVILGQIQTCPPTMSDDFKQIMYWVDNIRRLKVRTNADTSKDAKVGKQFGCDGIGLCRTEHMFFDPRRIDAIREMILADDAIERQKALDKILSMQKEDFIEIYSEMQDLPVTIRLLDPPLHEFIPQNDTELAELAERLGVNYEVLKRKADNLKETNPMLGHRGCRLGVSYPEIYKTQVRAIIETACELNNNLGFNIKPEIMIPLIGDYHELKYIVKYCDEEIHEVLKKYKLPLDYEIGTMIEVPRAALTADDIAKYADFFSFGTNDLTQTTLGISRDDCSSFLSRYLVEKIYAEDPFVTLDTNGVGELMKLALQKGKSTRTNLKCGICGEHGGDPRSVIFCHQIGLDYVSCSPYRVPIAKLAAAHAVLQNKK
jgi:pyruvate,orthophosphate dikinase